MRLSFQVRALGGVDAMAVFLGIAGAIDAKRIHDHLPRLTDIEIQVDFAMLMRDYKLSRYALQKGLNQLQIDGHIFAWKTATGRTIARLTNKAVRLIESSCDNEILEDYFLQSEISAPCLRVN